MRRHGKWTALGVSAACAAAVLGVSAASSQDKPDAGEKAISARQGLMQVISWEAGPLFGMAKGDIAYDADVAVGNATNLNAIAKYNVGRLFIDGTSKADRPGKTRALPELWTDTDKVAQAAEAFVAATALVAAEAGKGQAELAAAVGELGKSCGGCHKPFRAEEF